MEHGWVCPARARVSCAIIVLELEPLPQQVGVLIEDITEFLQLQFPVRVVSAFPSPFGVGLFQFQNPVQRALSLGCFAYTY